MLGGTIVLLLWSGLSFFSKGRKRILKALKCSHDLIPIHLTRITFESLALCLYLQQSLNTVSPGSVKDLQRNHQETSTFHSGASNINIQHFTQILYKMKRAETLVLTLEAMQISEMT